MSDIALPIRPPPRGVDLPTDDGEPLETGRHRDQMELLIGSLKASYVERRDVFVGGNMFVYYSETQAKKNDFRGPDVFVVVGCDPKERRSWVVWEEEGRTPDVVIELLSETTAAVARGTKKRIYAQLMKVSTYVLFDPWTGELEAYELDLGTLMYRPIEADPSGRVLCKPLGLLLGAEPGSFRDIEARWLRWLTPGGTVLRHGDEAAVFEKRRADDEKRRADDEKRRADDLEAQLRGLTARAAKDGAAG